MQTAVITGAGSGIGKAVTLAMLSAGYGVVQLRGDWQLETGAQPSAPPALQTSAESNPARWTKA